MINKYNINFELLEEALKELNEDNAMYKRSNNQSFRHNDPNTTIQQKKLKNEQNQVKQAAVAVAKAESSSKPNDETAVKAGEKVIKKNGKLAAALGYAKKGFIWALGKGAGLAYLLSIGLPVKLARGIMAGVNKTKEAYSKENARQESGGTLGDINKAANGAIQDKYQEKGLI